MSEEARGKAVERIFTSPLPYALGANEMGSVEQPQQGGLLMDALMARDADTVVASLLRRAQVIFLASLPPGRGDMHEACSETPASASLSRCTCHLRCCIAVRPRASLLQLLPPLPALTWCQSGHGDTLS